MLLAKRFSMLLPMCMMSWMLLLREQKLGPSEWQEMAPPAVAADNAGHGLVEAPKHWLGDQDSNLD